MKTKFSVCLCLLFWGHMTGLRSQNTVQSFPLKISVLDESISFPSFGFLTYSYNPALMLGSEYSLKQKPKSEWLISGNLGFFYHKQAQAAVFLTTEFGYRLHLGRWNFRLGLGPGYLHGFSTGPVYRLEDGSFSESSDWGNPSFLIAASAELGYKLADRQQSPELFLTWANYVELPLNAYTGAHQLVGIGLKFYPFNKANNR